jgi:hypothetical protein
MLTTKLYKNLTGETITGSDLTIRNVNRCMIAGSNLQIREASNCQITGDNIKLRGNNNSITGSNLRIQGFGNTINGQRSDSPIIRTSYPNSESLGSRSVIENDQFRIEISLLPDGRYTQRITTRNGKVIERSENLNSDLN